MNYKLIYMSELNNPAIKILGRLPENHYVSPGDIVRTECNYYKVISSTNNYCADSEFIESVIEAGGTNEIIETWHYIWTKKEEEEDEDNE